MENSAYSAILDAMPRTGVYVIREKDHHILYLNKRAKEISPEVEPNSPCTGKRDGACAFCLLPSMEGQREACTVSYNPHYGGVVDVTAARLRWEDGEPAFVITVDPRTDTSGYTYRKILHVNLDHDSCDVLKSDSDQLLQGGGTLSQMFERFARSGAVHPDDVERLVAFTSLEHMRSVAQSEEDTLTLIYRRKVDGVYHWNLMEVLPWQDGCHSALLCVKDVHKVLREGLEREGLEVRNQELIRSLGERNFDIYIIDLKTSIANPIRVDNEMREGLEAGPWTEMMRGRIQKRLHEAYQDKFEQQFSPEGLRRTKESGQQKSELLCQWRSGEDYRYISVTAYFGDRPEESNYTVVALQDVDERMRRELAHTKRDMQMAAILKSRYQMLNTVHLDTGVCERMNLSQSADPDAVLTGDYEEYIQKAVTAFVHPDDAEKFKSALSLEHLRRKAESVENYSDEICQYRLRGPEERWIEQHVLYSRQKDHVMVNILGQDITREKRDEEARLRALEDRAYMITSLSSLYFSTYYIDIERDTFRAVTQQRRISDVLGNEVNFTNALQLYASQFVHPDDRENYLQVMNLENFRQNLRWWQPYVTVEFRKLPDFPGAGGEPYQWVRATAVMSRVGADDLPKTAVYVARNITEDERK